RRRRAEDRPALPSARARHRSRPAAGRQWTGHRADNAARASQACLRRRSAAAYHRTAAPRRLRRTRVSRARSVRLMRPTALIADDEPLLREALTRQLAQVWPELEVVAQARNGREAVRH